MTVVFPPVLNLPWGSEFIHELRFRALKVVHFVLKRVGSQIV